MSPIARLSLLTLALLSACGQSASPPRPATLHDVEVNGLQLSYLERGSGPLVVLLHGFPDNARTWDSIAPRIAERGYRTVAPYLRGYPPSGAPLEDDFTILRLGQDVIGLIDALGSPSAIVIGHDWGALAAYAAANLAPGRVERIITLAIPHPGAVARHPETLAESPHFARFAQPDAAEVLRANDFAELERLIGVWAPDWEVPSDFLDSVKGTLSPPGVLEAVLGYYRDFSSLDPVLFEPTRVPCLAFSGIHDGAGSQLPFESQALLFDAPVRVVRLPVGHFIHHEAEGEVVDAMLEFLAPVEAESPQ